MQTHVRPLIAASLWCSGVLFGLGALAQEPNQLDSDKPTSQQPAREKSAQLKPNVAAEAVQQLTGTWTIVAGVNQGENVAADSLKGSRVIFGDSTIVVLDAEQKELYKAAFKLAGDKPPFKIDMTTELPNQKPTQGPGLLEFRGQTLRLCYALTGGQRPTKIESRAGSKHMLFEMKRIESEVSRPVPEPNSVSKSPPSEVLISSQHMLGADVVDADHTTLGTINQLVISRDGEWAHAVVKTGTGGGAVAIPLAAIRTESGRRDDLSVDESSENSTSWLIIDADLQQAPRLQSPEQAELSDANWLQRNLDYFEAKPSADAATVQVSELQAAGMVSVEELMDHEVVGGDGQSLASLDAVILRLNGQPSVPLAILSFGGLSGAAPEYVAIDFSKLQLDAVEEGEIAIALNASQLAEQQKVTPDSYPELRLQSVLKRVTKP